MSLRPGLFVLPGIRFPRCRACLVADAPRASGAIMTEMNYGLVGPPYSVSLCLCLSLSSLLFPSLLFPPFLSPLSLTCPTFLSYFLSQPPSCPFPFPSPPQTPFLTQSSFFPPFTPASPLDYPNKGARGKKRLKKKTEERRERDKVSFLRRSPVFSPIALNELLTASQ